jgi:hypothetical protein
VAASVKKLTSNESLPTSMKQALVALGKSPSPVDPLTAVTLIPPVARRSTNLAATLVCGQGAAPARGGGGGGRELSGGPPRPHASATTAATPMIKMSPNRICRFSATEPA